MSLEFLAPQTEETNSFDAIVEDYTGETSPAEGKDLGGGSFQLLEGVQESCPECGESFSGNTNRGAKRKLNTHLREQHPDSSHTPKTAVVAPGDRKPRGRQPKTDTKSRQSGADLLSMVADGIGSLVASTGIPSAPAGLALKLEAPLIGPAGDKALAGTIVDKKLVQPLIGAKSRFDEIGPLVMFPVLVGLIDKGILGGAQARPILRMVIGPILPQLVTALGKQKADAEKVQKAAEDLAEMDPLFSAIFAQGGDPVDAILNVLFPEPETTDGDQVG